MSVKCLGGLKFLDTPSPTRQIVIPVTAMNRALRHTAEDGSLRESAMTRIVFVAALALAIAASADSGE